jgi:NADH-quinone oxidoreductase subunit N
MAFLPELVVLIGALGLFGLSLGQGRDRAARRLLLAVAAAALLSAVVALPARGTLFDGAYQVDAFSQWLKLVLAVGFGLVALQQGQLPDIPSAVRPEYNLLLTLSVAGLMLLVSCIELITLFVALELASLPLFLLVAMRRERPGHRVQMESAIKYLLFGLTANGLMLFGLSYLFGLTSTTLLPVMLERLQAPLPTAAVFGLVLTFCGLFYKLALFPFHFWTPDVYQGASNETVGFIASLPKLGAVAVLVRFATLAQPDPRVVPELLSLLAVASMFYGNLIALAQTDLKRLLGFSAIAHAGYALVGFVALDQTGYTAALYYTVAYLFMALACFAVLSLLAPDGANVTLADLGGLYRRAPWLAVTWAVGALGLAGFPPFAGFMSKLTVLLAAWAKGHVTLVILTVLNTAIALYYYLAMVREAFLREPPEPAQAPIRLHTPARLLCLTLIALTVALGVVPGRFLHTVSSSLAWTRPEALGPARAAARLGPEPGVPSSSQPTGLPKSSLPLNLGPQHSQLQTSQPPYAAGRP